MYSHVWIGLAAAVQVVCSAMLSPNFESGVTFRYAALVFFASVSFYSFHRLYSLWRLLPTLPTKRWQAVFKLQRLLFALVPLGFLGALVLFVTLPWNWQWRIAFPAIVSALYAIPLIKWKRLRDFGSAKVLWLSVGWVWLCTVVPMSALGEMNWWLVFERLFFLVGLTLAFDWRDTEQDQMEGVITWPLRFGRVKTMWLSMALIAISVGLNIQLYSFGPTTLDDFAAQGLFVGSVFTGGSMVYAFAKTRPHHLYYGVYLDGSLVLPGLVAFLLWFFIMT